jgi:hypothetical protein
MQQAIATLKDVMGITHVLIQINLQERRDALMIPRVSSSRSEIKKRSMQKLIANWDRQYDMKVYRS